MFNIINSYDSQKDTIWNNINYLQYFYNLFPTHVNKFFWLFYRYVNPKIDELKKSINELYSQNNSITSEITNLLNTKETIENLSKQITTNVKELNNTIAKHDKFNRLVKAIKDHLEKSITELKDLDRTKEIDKIFVGILKETGTRAQKIVRYVKDEFDKHEKDVKGKIRRYTDTIKKILDVRIEKIPPLIDKIEKLVGKEPNKEGTLSKMADAVETFRYRHKNEIDYLEIVHIPDQWTIHRVAEMRPWPGDELEIKQIESVLNQIIGGLDDYLGNIKAIGDELNVYETGETYRSEIQKLGSMEKKLGGVGMENDSYWKFLESARNDFFKREELKRLTQTQKGNFTEKFIDDVKVATSVTHQELRRIHHGIEKELEQADDLWKRLNNTKFLLEYFDEFSKHKKILDEIELGGNVLSEIEQLIQSMEKFRDSYQDASSSIVGASAKLFSEFEKGEHISGIRHGARSEYLPKKMSLNAEPLVKFENHIKKLKAIKEFKDTLTGITSGMNKLTNGDLKQNKEYDVKKALECLGGIDGTLATVYESTNSATTKMKETHEKYQTQINDSDSANGAKIQEHVESIERIPAKIAELQISVKFYIRLTQILSNVIKTLDEMKPKAENLRETNDTVDKVKEKIPSIQKEFCLVKHNMIYLSYIGGKAGFYNVRRTVKKSKEYIGNIDISIGSIRTIEKNLEIRIAELKEYQEILEEMYTDVEHKTSQLINFVPGSHSNIPMLKALAELKTTSNFKSKEIIGQLAKTMLITTKLITTICRIQHSICCTKRKLGCFVDSLETRANWIGESVREVESSIECVIICFLKFSNKSIRNNKIESTKRMLNIRGRVYNNEPSRPSLRCLENIGCQYST